MTFRAALLAAAALLAGAPAFAQTWPSRPITLVVPFVAGSGTDTIARIISEKLAARLGQPVVVENKAGAASAIGTVYVAKAEARRLHAPDDHQQCPGHPAAGPARGLAHL